MIFGFSMPWRSSRLETSRIDVHRLQRLELRESLPSELLLKPRQFRVLVTGGGNWSAPEYLDRLEPLSLNMVSVASNVFDLGQPSLLVNGHTSRGSESEIADFNFRRLIELKRTELEAESFLPTCDKWHKLCYDPDRYFPVSPICWPLRRQSALFSMPDGGVIELAHFEQHDFRNNSSGNRGGAVPAEDQTTLRVFGSHFIDNAADHGGVIDSYRSAVEVSGSLFLGGAITVVSNDTGGCGSAEEGWSRDGIGVYAIGAPQNRAPVDMRRVAFVDCNIEQSAAGGGLVGGVALQRESMAVVSGTTFAHNTAEKWGGTLSITGSTEVTGYCFLTNEVSPGISELVSDSRGTAILPYLLQIGFLERAPRGRDRAAIRKRGAGSGSRSGGLPGGS